MYVKVCSCSIKHQCTK